MKKYFQKVLSLKNYNRISIIKKCVNELRKTYTVSNGPVQLENIENALLDLGIKQGDLVLVHSSTNSLYTGGEQKESSNDISQIQYAIEINNLLRSIVGLSGTILMPTDSFKDLVDFSREKKVFDYKKSPSRRGLITEIFRRRLGVIRSVNPWYNISGEGPLAEELMATHHLSSPYTMDRSSPWYKFSEMGGKIILLGTGYEVNSLIHMVEYIYPEKLPYAIYSNKPWPIQYKDRDQSIKNIDLNMSVNRYAKGDLHKFSMYLQEKYSLYQTAKIGNQTIIIGDAKLQFEAYKKELEAGVLWYDAHYWK